MEKIAVYPGSFDPPTNGHIDIVKRGLKIFDGIIVAIMRNPNKTGLFTIDERKEMLEASLVDYPNVEIDAFEGLTVDYAAQKGVTAMIRGMRVVSDFEGEFQLAMINRKLNKEIETVSLMAGLSWVFISSSIVKEAASFGGDVTNMVPPLVNQRLKEKFAVT